MYVHQGNQHILDCSTKTRSQVRENNKIPGSKYSQGWDYSSSKETFGHLQAGESCWDSYRYYRANQE